MMKSEKCTFEVKSFDRTNSAFVSLDFPTPQNPLIWFGNTQQSICPGLINLDCGRVVRWEQTLRSLIHVEALQEPCCKSSLIYAKVNLNSHGIQLRAPHPPADFQWTTWFNTTSCTYETLATVVCGAVKNLPFCNPKCARINQCR